MKKISISNIIIYLLSCLSLFISFYFNEDGSNTPLSGDFRDTWPYVLNLKEDILSDPTGFTVHYPLHYFLLSRINFIITDPTNLRFFMMLIALSLPFFLFKALDKKYENKNRNILFIISLCIFFTPAYRYASIWANDRITTDIFILIGSYFFFIFQKNNKNLKNLYTSLFFFALACYSRQYYAVYYSLFLIYIYNNCSFKIFLSLSAYSFLLSLPGFYILFESPFVFGGLKFSGNVFNTFLGNVSSLFVYTIPIIFINLIFKKIEFFNLKKLIFYFLFSCVIFIIIYIFHDISTMDENGGAFLIFSKLIFNNYLPFYCVFLINLILLLLIFENYQDRLIMLSIVLIFSGRIVVQSLFEPLFFLFFFLYSKSKFKNIFLNDKKATYSLFGYYIFYYLVSVSDILYKISF